MWSRLISHVIDTYPMELYEVGGSGGYYSPRLTTLPLGRAHRIICKAIGLLIRIGLIWGQDLHRISPMLIAYILSGDITGSVSSDFIRRVDPGLGARIDSWDPARIIGQPMPRLPVHEDPMLLLFLGWDGEVTVGDS